jgi:uncharacterized RDD family membrane protein YckC
MGGVERIIGHSSCQRKLPMQFDEMNNELFQPERVNLVTRAAAYAIDLVFVVPLQAALAVMAMGKGLGAATTAGTEFWGVMLAANFFALPLLYFCFEIVLGATPGKLLMGIRIATDSATPAPYGKLLARWAVKQSPFIVMLAASLLSSQLMFNAGLALAGAVALGTLTGLAGNKRAVHDMLTGTAVYRPAQYQLSPAHAA